MDEHAGAPVGKTAPSSASDKGIAAPIAEEGELFRTHIGGSAVVEGVMMRGKRGWAVSVREETGGMHVEERALPAPEARPRWMRLPIVRGCVSFAESMAISYRALNIAVEHAYAEDGPEVDSKDGAEATGRSPDAVLSDNDGSGEGLSSAAMTASMVVGLLLGVALFVALPVAVTNLVVGELEPGNAIAWNLVEALLRIAVLVAYVGLIGFMPDMARMYGYHGAEHQAIHCYEHGLPLTPENCMRFSRFHVRCGTAFLVMTVAVAILVNTLVPVGNLADVLGISGVLRGAFVFCSRLVLLPLVAGLSYEVTVKWAGSHPDNPLVRIVLWPGLQMQRLTTRVPDRGMLECAISSLERVRAQEEGA